MVDGDLRGPRERIVREHGSMARCIGFACVCLVLAYLAVIGATNGPYSHDEESYLGSALFAMDLTPYRDFIHFQTPLYPLVTQVALELSSGQYFLAGRMVTLSMTLLAISAMIYAGWLLSRSLLAASLAGIMFCTSTVMIPAMGVARNDMMAAALGIWSCAFFLRGMSGGSGRSAFLMLAGLFSTAAAAAKISYAFVPLSLVIYIALLMRFRPQQIGVRDGILLVLGMAIGAVPLIYYAVVAAENFYYGVLGHFSYAPEVWQAHLNSKWELTWAARLRSFLHYVFSDIGLGCLIICLYWILLIHKKGGGRFRSDLERLVHTHALLPLILCFFAVPLTVLPRPSYIQYFQLVIPFLILSAIGLMVVARRSGVRGTMRLMAVAVLCSSVPGVIEQYDLLQAPSVVAQLQSQAKQIRSSLGTNRVDGPVATLSPVRVAVAGYPVYREFAGGPFFFRTGDALSRAEIHRLRGVTPDTLASLFDSSPPGAIFVGFEDLEDPRRDGALVDYAETHGYVLLDDYKGKGRLYVRGSARDDADLGTVPPQ